MSGNSNEKPIEKAGEIIELFGGIRPMASKMDVAVTTVQGWKKRNVIPGNRRNEVVRAAQKNNIKLAPYINVETTSTAAAKPSAPASTSVRERANQNAPQVKPQAQAAKPHEAPKEPTKPVAASANAAKTMSQNAKPHVKPAPESMKKAGMSSEQKLQARSTSDAKAPNSATHAQLQALTKKAARRNLYVTGSMVVVAVAAGFFFFSGEDVSRVKQDISALKTGVSSLDERTTTLEGWLPKDLNKNLAEMKKETKELGAQVGRVAATLSEGSGSVLDRISRLEGQIANGSGGQALQDMMARIETLSSSVNGQQDISAAMRDLSSVVTGLQAQVDGVDVALERAKQDNDALAEALEGVTGRDLGAAALLLALEHARTSFNRNEPFEDDLKVLQGVVGENDPELNAAIERLAPYAENGVLSTDNLSDELTSLSGDIVMAKMKGEDVSIQDKALQRFNEIVSVTKNGVPVTGGEEEVIIAKAQEALAKGDVAAAQAALSKLEGGAADAVSPWMDQAEGNLAAQNLEEVILQQVVTGVQGLRSGGLFDSLGGESNVLIDPNTGMAISQ